MRNPGQQRAAVIEHKQTIEKKNKNLLTFFLNTSVC